MESIVWTVGRGADYKLPAHRFTIFEFIKGNSDCSCSASVRNMSEQICFVTGLPFLSNRLSKAKLLEGSPNDGAKSIHLGFSGDQVISKPTRNFQLKPSPTFATITNVVPIHSPERGVRLPAGRIACMNQYTDRDLSKFGAEAADIDELFGS